MAKVNIKSFPNGISLHIDENADFSDILEELSQKFEDSRKFFKTSKVALAIENRAVSNEEEKLIIQTIEKHSDVEILCIVGKNNDTNKNFLKALKRLEDQKEENNGRMYVGDVLENDIIESEGNLTVIGDIQDGGACACKGSLIVLGIIYGHAYAGMNGNKEAFIVAGGIDSTNIKIAGYKYSSKIKGIFGKKKKNQFCVLKLKDEKIKANLIDDMNFREFI